MSDETTKDLEVDARTRLLGQLNGVLCDHILHFETSMGNAEVTAADAEKNELTLIDGHKINVSRLSYVEVYNKLKVFAERDLDEILGDGVIDDEDDHEDRQFSQERFIDTYDSILRRDDETPRDEDIPYTGG